MRQGIKFALITAVISGISIFSNAVFVSKADPLVFAFMRNALVIVICSALLIGQSKLSLVAKLSLKQWGLLALIGIVGGGIPFALFFTGLSQIGAVSGNLIQKTLFLWVLLLAVPILKERVSRIQIVGYGVLLAGMFYSGSSISILPKMGTWLILVATILWAIEQIIAKLTLKTVDPLIVAWGRMVFGLPCLALAIGMSGKTGLLFSSPSYVITPLVVSALLLTAYMSAWYRALSVAPATLVSSVLVIAPVVTAILSRIVLHKPFVEGQILSSLMLVLGATMVIGQYVKRSQHASYES